MGHICVGNYRDSSYKVFAAVLAVTLSILVSSSAHGSILNGPISNPANGHAYYLLTQDTFSGSEAQAVALGGHLVTINDHAENEFVAATFATFGGQNRALGTGFNDILLEGTFRWISGEPATFTNFAPGEPNNGGAGGGDEDWAYLVEPGNPSLPARKWNDAPASASIHGIVEVVPEPTSLALAACGLGLLCGRRRRA